MKPMTPEHITMLKEICKLAETVNKPPAFQFYVQDWLGSSTILGMTPAQEGAYIRLLACCWDNPQLAIPNDHSKLSMMSRLNTGWKELGPAIIDSFFREHPVLGHKWLTNVRLVEVRHHQLTKQIQSREANEIKARKAPSGSPSGSPGGTPLPSFRASGLPGSLAGELSVPCASAAPKSRGGMSNPEAKALMDWFYGRWATANGGQEFPTATAPYPKEYKAAERLLKAYPDYEVKLTGLLDGALAGHYFAAPPDCIANFKPTRYTKTNLKPGFSCPTTNVKPTPEKTAEVEAERKRLRDQTECAAEKRFGEPRDCGKLDICRNCPQLETPGKGRYSPGSDNTGLIPGGGLKPIVGKP